MSRYRKAWEFQVTAHIVALVFSNKKYKEIKVKKKTCCQRVITTSFICHVTMATYTYRHTEHSQQGVLSC